MRKYKLGEDEHQQIDAKRQALGKICLLHEAQPSARAVVCSTEGLGKLNPFDKAHQSRIMVVSGSKRSSTAVYNKCRFDGKGVMSVEPVTIELKDKATQYGKAMFDGLVLRNDKLRGKQASEDRRQKAIHRRGLPSF